MMRWLLLALGLGWLWAKYNVGLTDEAALLDRLSEEGFDE